MTPAELAQAKAVRAWHEANRRRTAELDRLTRAVLGLAEPRPPRPPDDLPF